MEAEDKKEDVDSDDDLFVKFKPNEKIKPKKKEKRAAINGNKYKYCGKIKDFKVFKQIVKKSVNKNLLIVKDDIKNIAEMDLKISKFIAHE